MVVHRTGRVRRRSLSVKSRHARIHYPPRGRQVGSAQLESQDKDPCTQPSEPILFPKLRIYFADFPYLRYSIGQRLFTLETCCGYGYEFARNLHTSLPILSRANASASDGTRPVPLLVVVHPISGQTDSRDHLNVHLIRKDNSSRNLCQRLWIHLCYHTSSA